jgi:predicted component of type VI protein secretion system
MLDASCYFGWLPGIVRVMARLDIRLTGPGIGTDRAVATIGESGGWIGRAPDSEVAIDDASRIVSSRHARIDWDGTAFGLTDQSMNGTDLNGRRLQSAERVPLHAGDDIRIGSFHLLVSDAEDPTGGAALEHGTRPGMGPLFDLPSGQSVQAMGRPRGAPAAGDAPGDRFTMDLNDLIGTPPEAPPRPVARFGDVVPQATAPLPTAPLPTAPLPTAPLPTAPLPAAPLPALPAEVLPAEPPARWEPESEASPADPQALLAAFWRGLGVGAPHAPTPQMMEAIGLAMHEALVGIAAIPGADGQENPLRNGVRDIRRHLGAPQPQLAEHVRAAFAAGQARVASIHAAVGQAALGLAESLSARAIEARLAAAVRSRLFRRAALWRYFRALESEVRDAALHRFHTDLAERLKGGDPVAQLTPPDLPHQRPGRDAP